MFWQYHLDGVRDRGWVFHSQNPVPAGLAQQANRALISMNVHSELFPDYPAWQSDAE